MHSFQEGSMESQRWNVLPEQITLVQEQAEALLKLYEADWQEKSNTLLKNKQAPPSNLTGASAALSGLVRRLKAWQSHQASRDSKEQQFNVGGIVEQLEKLKKEAGALYPKDHRLLKPIPILEGLCRSIVNAHKVLYSPTAAWRSQENREEARAKEFNQAGTMLVGSMELFEDALEKASTPPQADQKKEKKEGASASGLFSRSGVPPLATKKRYTDTCLKVAASLKQLALATRPQNARLIQAANELAIAKQPAKKQWAQCLQEMRAPENTSDTAKYENVSQVVSLVQQTLEKQARGGDSLGDEATQTTAVDVLLQMLETAVNEVDPPSNAPKV